MDWLWRTETVMARIPPRVLRGSNTPEVESRYGRYGQRTSYNRAIAGAAETMKRGEQMSKTNTGE